MREIKFRAWDKIKNEIVEAQSLEDQTWNVYLSMTKPESSGWVFMQYTGLKDKNGKDIYEGDVMQIDKTTTQVIEWGYHDLGHDGGEFWGFNWGWTIPINECYTIGNIHENPELLKS